MKRFFEIAALFGALALGSCADKSPSGSGAGPEDISPPTEAERNMNATPNAPAPTSSDTVRTMAPDTMDRGR